MKTNSVLTLAVTSLLLSATAAFSGTGIFGTGVTLSSTISGISAFKLYEITLLGDSRLAPNTGGGGVSLGAPVLVNTDNGSGTSTWATGGTGQPSTGPSLGTFQQGVDTLTLNGGEDLTYKNSGNNVSAAQVFYQLDGGGFNQISLVFNQDNVNSNSGDQRWYFDGANINLLSGLSVGSHTFSIYFRDDNNVADPFHDYISNLNHNYSATFTIAPAPEPTAGILVASGLGMFFLIRRRR